MREMLFIGAGAVIGMGSVRLHDVPAGEVWAGVPGQKNSKLAEFVIKYPHDPEGFPADCMHASLVACELEFPLPSNR